MGWKIERKEIPKNLRENRRRYWWVGSLGIFVHETYSISELKKIIRRRMGVKE